MILGTLSSEKYAICGAGVYRGNPFPAQISRSSCAKPCRISTETILETELSDTDLEENIQSLPADPEARNFSYTVCEWAHLLPGELRHEPCGSAAKYGGQGHGADPDAATACGSCSTRSLRMLRTRKSKPCSGGLTPSMTILPRAYGLINTTANPARLPAGQRLQPAILLWKYWMRTGKLKRKADIFTKRTIRKPEPVDSVDTASEALALSIGEKACVDLKFMSSLCGKNRTGKSQMNCGASIFQNPVTHVWENQRTSICPAMCAGNCARRKTRPRAAPEYAVNAEALRRVQPQRAGRLRDRSAPWRDVDRPPFTSTGFLSDVLSVPAWMAGRTIRTQYFARLRRVETSAARAAILATP